MPRPSRYMPIVCSPVSNHCAVMSWPPDGPNHARSRVPPVPGSAVPLISLPSKNASCRRTGEADRKSTRLNSSHANISYAAFCLKKISKQVAQSDEQRGADRQREADVCLVGVAEGDRELRQRAEERVVRQRRQQLEGAALDVGLM